MERFAEFMPAAIVALWALAAALIGGYAGGIAREITYVTLADGRREARSIPLLLKLLLPLAPNLTRFAMRPAFDRARERADSMILMAGLEGLIDGREFIALKILSPTVFGTCSAAFVLSLAALIGEGSFISDNAASLAAVGFIYFYAYPLMWLRKAVKARHASIMRSLPFVLDLLTLSVEAGMDFMSALQRNCERRRMDPLNEELLRMIREIQVGTPRRVALANMAARAGQGDLKSVANALIQADELGVSMGAILRIQSDQLRSRRFDRAERLANEAPVKMLGPLLLFIFPAVFVILLGPVLAKAAGLFF